MSAGFPESVQEFDGAGRQIERFDFARSGLPDFHDRIIVKFLIEKSSFDFASRFALISSRDGVLQVDAHTVAACK